MKQKPLLILIAVIVLVAVSYYGYHTYRQAQIKQAQTITTTDKYAEYDKSMAEMKWLQRYPQLKNVASGSMTATIDKLRTSESISELIGPIDNAYGVRNDILDKILSIVPESNPQMLQAAIRTAYYDNLSYYSTSDESRLYFVRKASLAASCFANLDSENDLNTFNKEMTDEDNMMRNSSARNNWMTHVDQTTFAWQLIGSGLAQSEEDELCQKGNY